MPLGLDVDLHEIAEHSHGFVGADLEALCQEVGMIALRRFLSSTRLPSVPAALERPTLQPGTAPTPRTADDESADLGTLEITRSDFLTGLKEVEPSATREFFIEKSPSTFASLGGLDEVKRLLDAVVDHAHLHGDVYEQVGLAPPRGILLVGPSGTGKTAMARALSGEKQIPLIAIDGPQLYSKWLGESEKALREVFKKARRTAPCLLFFDTIDAIAPRIGADHFGADVYQRILGSTMSFGLRNRMPPTVQRSSGSAAGACRWRPTSTLRIWPSGRRASPEPTSRPCAKRRRCLRLPTFSAASTAARSS
jgi:transitional endoplasmic reticulum ATPase